MIYLSKLCINTSLFSFEMPPHNSDVSNISLNNLLGAVEPNFIKFFSFSK